MGDSIGIFRVSALACNTTVWSMEEHIISWICFCSVDKSETTHGSATRFCSNRVLSPAGDLLTSAYESLKFVFLGNGKNRAGLGATVLDALGANHLMNIFIYFGMFFLPFGPHDAFSY